MSFVENPMYFEFQTDSAEMVTVNVEMGGFEFDMSLFPYLIAEDTYKFSFDLSELLKKQVMPVIDETKEKIEGIPGYLNSYTITMTGYSYTGYALPGGISKEYQRWLAANNTNAFTHRYKNSTENLLLQTRTDDYSVKIRRRELGYVCFISCSDDTLSVASDKGDVLNLTTNTANVPIMVNLKKLAETWKTATEEVKGFYFKLSGSIQFGVKVIDETYEESYLIRFVNSFGFHDTIEVTGKMNSRPEFGAENTVETFDTVIRDFATMKADRTERSEVFTVETGYKSREDMRLIADLLSSKECWFIDGSSVLPCRVSAESYSRRMKRVLPESTLLTIKLVDIDKHITPMWAIDKTIEILATEDNKIITTENGELISV